ncbi:T9SS type A sorting domain-containing protein [Flavobacterium sp. IMCC34852]|uniref:T9SS type A sorting domain-containing protein n=1 Tax=Flavobacterium rivulicola TaxID=2732161 RepID=A0A7Y3VYJ9_9FLAO|nr:immunoglobulin domain-containing protein [Flavobacterium sp. IMCC34852]NNT71775.1 T9SS type A sorting domain-containing protein [Flavobacterium sp. IMCC34852]
MINNYTILNSRSTTGFGLWQSNEGNSPISLFGLRKMWFVILLFALNLISMQTITAQVSFSQNFDVNSTGWTGFSRFTGTTACGGTGGSMRFNLYSSSTFGNLVSPLVGVATGGNITIGYSYKAANWSANTVGTNPWGSFNVQYASSTAGPWTTIATVSQETQNGSCISKTHSFTPPAGNLYIRFSASWSSGDYYLNFDNVTLSESVPACTGTPDPANITGTSALCANTGTTLSLSTTYPFSGISRQWKSSLTPGGPYTDLGTAPTQATGNLSATTYYVCDIICSGGGTFTTPEFTVLVNQLPPVTVSSSASFYCNPGGTAVSLIAGGALTYTWSPAAGLSGTSGQIVSATPTSTTTYTVTGTDGNACQNTATATVTVFGVPQGVSATATPPTVCIGGTTTVNAFASIPSTVNNYAFAASSGAALDPMVGATQVIGTNVDDTASGSLTLPFTFNFNGVDYTTYTVSPDGWLKFGAAGSSDFSNQVTESTNLPKLYPHWDDLATGTDGNVKVLTIGSAPNRIFVVQWFVTSPRATTGPANSTFQAWMYEGSNKVEFRYGAFGGASGSASVGLTGSSAQYQSITLSSNTASTSAANDNNNIAPVAGTSYVFTPPTATFTWSPAGDVVNATSQSTATNPIAATKTFNVVASNNGCDAAPASVTVSVNPLVCAAATYTSPNCAGSDFTVTANISGGGAPYSYAWSDGAGGVYPDAATITANLPAGTYNFTCVVSDSCGASCSSNVTVVVNALPTVTVAPTSALYCNPGTPVALTASGAATYAWSPAAGLSATTGSVVNASPSSATTYTVVGTDANGCVAPSVSSAITVQPGPTAIALSSSAATVCNGTTVTLNATGGNISVTSPLSFGTNLSSNGSVTLSVPLEITGIPSGAVISSAQLVLDNVSAIGGSFLSEIRVGLSGAHILDPAESISTLTGGTLSTASIALPGFTATSGTVNLLLSESFNDGGDAIDATFGEVRLVISYSVPATLTWSSNPATPLYTDAAATSVYTTGNFTTLYAKPTAQTQFSVEASLGSCSVSGSATVAVNQLPVFSAAPITICNGTTGTLSASSLESNSYAWTPVGGGATLSGASVMVSPTETTTYNVTATSNTTVPACSSTQQVTVTVNEPGTIVSGTASRTVSPGQLTTFEVVTTGLVTYQWQVNNNVDGWQNILAADPNYSGENTAVLSLQNITLAFDTYQYRCLVTGLAPCVTLTPIEAILNVTNTGFSTQPADVNLCGQSSTSFSIVTTGDEPYNVQWQMSTDGGASFNDIFDGPDASGLTFAGVNDFSPKTLSVSGITTAHNGYQFKCQLDFFLDSGIATLTVNTPVTLTNNFSSAPVVRCSAPSAAATSFGISTTGSVAAVEWKYATSASGPWNTIAAGFPTGASYSGVSSNTLSVTTTAATPVGNYYYKAFVTGAGSGANKCPDAESAVATISVVNPTITVSPSSAAYCTPGPAVTLTAAGSDISSYSWTASGFTTTTGTSIAVTPSAATTYTVTGTDSNGCTNTAQATVTVGGAFSLAATSSAATVCPGNPVTLNATPTPLSGVSYLINAIPYQFNAVSGSFTPLAGTVATAISGTADDTASGALPIGFTFNYGGTNYTNFRVNSNGLLSFGAGSSTASNALNSTTSGVRPGIAPLWDDLQCSASGITYQVSGSAPNRVLTVEWLNMEWNWSSSQNAISFQVKLYEGTNAVELVYRNELPAGNPGGSGGASVGLMGTATSNFISLQDLTASPAISTTTSANGLATKPASGQTYRFTPVAPVTYTYAWSSTPSGFTASTAGATANPAVNTTYDVTATSNAGCTASASVAVSVDAAPPVITTQPLTQQLCQGSTATLSVAASSATALSYQWYKDNVAITGNASATTATLTLTGTTPANSGSYTVTVTNCSTVTSEAAVLTIYPTPTAVAPVAQAYCIDATVPATPLTGTPSGVTFNISGGAALGLANQTGVTQIPSFTPTAAGTATISITPVANGCTGPAVTYTLRINALPTAPLLSVNTPICEGSSLDFASSVAVQQGYTLNSNSNVAFIDISATGTSVGAISDDSEHGITIPSFIYNGTPYTTALVGNNGAMTFGVTTGNIGFTNTALPGSTANLAGTAATICALWDDLTPGTGGSIRTQTVGNKFIVQWTQEDNFGATGTGTVTFQIQLDLTTSQIHLVYPDIIYGVVGYDNAQTATIGLNYSSTSALQYSFNTASILNGQSLTFTPAAYSYAWSGPNGFTSALANPTIANATPAATGDYTLEITNGNGCKSSSTIPAVVYPTPTVVAPANQTYYTGFATAAIPLVGTPSNVTFNISGGAASGLADVNGVTEIPSFIPTATPSTVTITPVANGCVGAPVTFQISFVPVVVNIESNVCGSINNGLNNQINCTNISIPGYTTTGYQFEVTNMSTGEVSIVFSSQHHFKLTDASNYSYGTTFSIRVAVVLDGNVQGYYGSTCSLTTTEVRTTKVVTSQCGATLVFVNSTINANGVSSTNLYRFRVALASAPTVTYLVERTVPNFKLTDVIGLPIQYNTEYLVDVQVRVKLAGFEAWSQYGERCSVFTPEAPESSLIASQCEDYQVTSDTELINVIPFPGATAYRFRLTGYDEFGDVNYTQTVTSSLPYFTLSMFTGLTPGTTYTVGVSMELFGVYTDFGKDCTIITPVPARQVSTTIVEPFKATAYPNPFAANFMIDVKTSSTSVIAIKVYDMVGRLVEQRTTSVTELDKAPIGTNYPSGVYNVVVTQDDAVQTVRVVKR